MFESFSEIRLLRSLERRALDLRPHEKLWVLSSYIELKSVRIMKLGSMFESCCNNPFSYPEEASEERMEFLAFTKQMRQNLKRMGMNKEGHPDLFAGDLLAALFGLTFVPEGAPTIINIYNALFAGYEKRLEEIECTNLMRKRGFDLLNEEDRKRDGFLSNCFVFDPFYPLVIINTFKDDIDFVNKINTLQNARNEEEHSDRSLIVNAINYLASLRREKEPESRFDRISLNQEIVDALVDHLEIVSLPNTVNIYKRNRAYDAVSTIDSLLFNVAQCRKPDYISHFPLLHHIITKHYDEILDSIS